jgi:hypothetical protein
VSEHVHDVNFAGHDAENRHVNIGDRVRYAIPNRAVAVGTEGVVTGTDKICGGGRGVVVDVDGSRHLWGEGNFLLVVEPRPKEVGRDFYGRAIYPKARVQYICTARKGTVLEGTEDGRVLVAWDPVGSKGMEVSAWSGDTMIILTEEEVAPSTPEEPILEPTEPGEEIAISPAPTASDVLQNLREEFASFTAILVELAKVAKSIEDDVAAIEAANPHLVDVRITPPPPPAACPLKDTSVKDEPFPQSSELTTHPILD